MAVYAAHAHVDFLALTGGSEGSSRIECRIFFRNFAHNHVFLVIDGVVLRHDDEIAILNLAGEDQSDPGEAESDKYSGKDEGVIVHSSFIFLEAGRFRLWSANYGRQRLAHFTVKHRQNHPKHVYHEEHITNR